MKKFFLQIFGCQMNYSDAERVATVLKNCGFEEAASENDADVFIFVTCSVRQKAEDRVFGALQKLAKWKAEKTGRQIGITGCMTRTTSTRDSEKRDRLLARAPLLDFVFRIEDTAALPQILGEEIGGERVENYFAIPPSHRNPAQVFVPIMTGCDNFCTYCIVPHARGREQSRPADEVVAECEAAVKNGALEINLLGQNVDSYQKTAGEFAKLLDRVAKIPNLKRLRFTSSHPKDFDDSVIDVMAAHKNIERHLHLPAQHGDAEILRRMNRNYTPEKYLAIVEKFRAANPESSVTTDLIVGFPGETDEQFENLLDFYRAANFDFAFFAQYSPRSGTPAADFPDQISAEKKAERWHAVNELLKKTTGKNYEKYLGRTLEVLVEKFENGICEGRSSELALVKFAGSASEVGKLIPVKITEAREVELAGEKLFS